MFNNLIESSSHKREFKRRGSFFLYTVAAYVLLFTAAGVASIYAYDAQLDEQTEQIITMLRPVDFPSAPKNVVTEPAHTPKPPRGENTMTERQALVARTDMPQLQPTTISTKPNTELPVPIGIPFRVTGRDKEGDYGSPLGSSSGTPSGTGTGPSVVQITVPPPPPVTPKPAPQVLRKSVINGEALELPKPPYPQLAKINRIQGMVSVQVLIDEGGKVISAHALSGNAFLQTEAVRAAYRARFSPTKIGDQPVKVSGTITYNFVLQ
jgi:TonB family protein